jgi:transcriptional regulator with PAS, ATPase and Fis domain
VHESSRRRERPFVTVNCAAIPGELLEAELFGVAPGAATGVAQRPGLFLAADGGTLFLDEIGDMPLALQGKLLRAVENGEVPRVGGGVEHVDVRIVAATNRDLPEQVARGAFRADLYYRIATHVLRIPPLRERRDDIPALVEHLLGRAVAEQGAAIAGLSAAALEGLLAYPWPGNVRELENEVRRLVAACPEGGLIDSTLLSETVRGSLAPETREGAGEAPTTLQDQVDGLERRLIVRALIETGGNRSRAAERLGIHRNSLAAKLARLGIDPARPFRNVPESS